MITKGFTLLELIIVMALLGILAVVVFSVMNPGELLARSRDTGRITAVTVLGRGVTLFFTSKEGSYPPEATWGEELVNEQAVSSFPKGIEYSQNSVTPCTTNPRPSENPAFCYTLDSVGSNGALVYSKLESAKNVIKCMPQNVYVVYSSVDGKAGLICTDSDPVPWSPGTQNYVN